MPELPSSQLCSLERGRQAGRLFRSIEHSSDLTLVFTNARSLHRITGEEYRRFSVHE